VKRYIELSDRVLSYEVTPGDEVPGHINRTLRVAVESGPPLSVAEYQRVSAACVAELVAAGAEVFVWGGIEEDEAE
jgi:hypothetical protein